MTEQYLKIIPALIFMLILIIGLAWLAKRFAPALTRPSGTLSILASLHLGGKEKVVLIKAGEDYLLLGVSPGRVQTLHQMDKQQIEAIVEEGEVSNGAGFASLLQNFSRKY